jgi:c-di-GMP-related signal transduction protein
VVEEVASLKSAGYTIALDDFVFAKGMESLVALADIIKIDVRLTPLPTILKTLRYLSRFKIKLLAEKVETSDEYEKANKLGFHYFQGYFFNKPEKVLIKELSSLKITLFSLLAEIARKQTTLERLHLIISKDLAISYKLLRFLNSAYFYRLEKVKSVKHAIAFLGEKELRRFLILVIVSELAMEKPSELVRHSLLRAKFCELLARKSIFAEYDLEVFMVGMFSFMDAMLDIEMGSVMEKLPVSDEVKDALVYQTGILAPFLEAVIATKEKIINFSQKNWKSCILTQSLFRISILKRSNIPTVWFERLIEEATGKRVGR